MLSLLLVVAGALAFTSGTAGAVDQPGGTLVQDTPAGSTPHVLDGAVLAVAQVGDTIVLGGSFTSARNSNSQTQLTRTGLLAFDANTGQISTSFTPNPSNTVRTVIPAGDGVSVFVGGDFNSLGGVSRDSLARVRVSDGAVLTSFNAGSINGRVRDLHLSDGRLWVSGSFSSIGGQGQTALATVDPDTGDHDPFMSVPISGFHNNGSTNTLKIDITPDGSRLVAIGNFSTVAGRTDNQITMLELDGPSAQPSSWHTSFYSDSCLRRFWTYMRDVSFSPDGSWFVVGTTGAYRGGPPGPCDTIARFETDATGNDVDPTWIDYPGGDTTTAVEVTDDAVYVGGHQRWMNNPFRGDEEGPGAVPRDGIAALDPSNGLPYSWNPGRTRGVGVHDFLPNAQGLWFSSDTDRVAGFYRGRIALMPAGGSTVEPITTPQLPADVHVGDHEGNGGVVSHSLDDSDQVGAEEAVPSGGINWGNVRGGFMIDDTLYLGHQDGSFTRRTFDGSSYGSPTDVDTHDDLVTLAAWHQDVQNMTGMFFDGGRIYFTRQGSDTLYYRYFTPESDVVGAQRFVASGNVNGLDLSQVRGMFRAGDRIYWAEPDGSLNRIAWEEPTLARPQHGAPVGGTASQVSGPGVDSYAWDASTLFLHGDGGGGGPSNNPPQATFTADCVDLTCDFDASGSSDPDGDTLSYSWDFGDNTQGSGETTSRTYGSEGSYDVVLTVSDGQLEDTFSDTVNPTEPGGGGGDLAFVGSAGSSGNRTNHSVTLPGNVQAGDTLVMFLTANRDGLTVQDPGGWQVLESVNGNRITGRAYTRTATAGDAGSTVTVGTGVRTKSTVAVTVYRDDDGVSGVSASAGAAQNSASTTLTTPSVPVADAGSWYVGSWGAKESGTPTITPPGSVTTRQTLSHVGGGNITSVAGDSGGPVSGGTAGDLTATADTAVNKAVTFSVVVSPDG